MSTDNDDLIARVNARIRQLKVPQTNLAFVCNLSQGHLSKVLSKKLKLAFKTEIALRGWLDKTERNGDVTSDSEIHSIIHSLLNAPSSRRMQIMHLLRVIDGLVH